MNESTQIYKHTPRTILKKINDQLKKFDKLYSKSIKEFGLYFIEANNIVKQLNSCKQIKSSTLDKIDTKYIYCEGKKHSGIITFKRNAKECVDECVDISISRNFTNPAKNIGIDKFSITFFTDKVQYYIGESNETSYKRNGCGIVIKDNKIYADLWKNDLCTYCIGFQEITSNYNLSNFLKPSECISLNTKQASFNNNFFDAKTIKYLLSLSLFSLFIAFVVKKIIPKTNSAQYNNYNYRLNTKVKKLETEKKKLHSANERLRQQNETVSKEKKRLQESNNKFQAYNNKLYQKNKKALEDNQKLSFQKYKVSGEKERLQEHNHKLQEVNENLKNEITRLNIKIKDITEEANRRIMHYKKKSQPTDLY